jgi:hypothetical protein
MVRWAGHVARTENIRNAHKIVNGTPEDLGVDGMIILK